MNKCPLNPGVCMLGAVRPSGGRGQERPVACALYAGVHTSLVSEFKFQLRPGANPDRRICAVTLWP